ncbi:MAG: IS110 family transposase [Candidatus Thorarchaeota archaeon]|nr:MAG: IS110 family transposase [Candidatus Thorarchaeota archaeon]
MFNTFVGIDISLNSFNASILDEKGNIITCLKLNQNLKDFQKLQSALTKVAKRNDIILGLESSSNYHINLLSFLISNNFTVVLINPILISNFHKSISLRKTKTDKIDATTIARFLIKNHDRIHQFIPDDSIKLLARERETIAQEIAKLKTQIKQLVFNLFKELGDAQNVLTKSMLEFLLQIPSARSAREIGIEGIENILNDINRKRGRKIKLTAHQVMEIARNTISINDVNREIILRSRIRRLLYLQEEIEDLTSSLLSKMQFFRPIEMEILTSIKGVGEISAATFLAEIQDIHRFMGSHKKLIAYAGLDPIILQSGKFKGKFRISKRGNPHLRRIIWSMTLGTIFSTQRFKNYYQRKRAQGMSHKKAVIATSNKLLRVIFFLLNSDTLFHDIHPSPLQIIHS